jgi:hypothetical protein
MIYYMQEPLDLLAQLPQNERRYYRLSPGDSDCGGSPTVSSRW